MPTFCRHNRFLHTCPICSREQAEASRPAPPSRSRRPSSASTPGRRGRAGTRGEVRVRRLARGADDGYESPLLPGLGSSADAARLAEEAAWAAGRVVALAAAPPGPYAEAAAMADREDGLELAFRCAVLGPLEPPAPSPWAGIEAVRDGLPLAEAPRGARGAPDPARAEAAWHERAERAGGRRALLTGDAGWTASRRFARAWERVALPGLGRNARYELLVLAGRLGLVELEESTLGLGGDDEVTLAAKRVFGIGDALLLERRAESLAEALGVPLAALDLALWNWGRGERARLGFPEETGDEDALARARRVLGL